MLVRELIANVVPGLVVPEREYRYQRTIDCMGDIAVEDFNVTINGWEKEIKDKKVERDKCILKME